MKQLDTGFPRHVCTQAKEGCQIGIGFPPLLESHITRPTQLYAYKVCYSEETFEVFNLDELARHLQQYDPLELKEAITEKAPPRGDIRVQGYPP